MRYTSDGLVFPAIQLKPIVSQTADRTAMQPLTLSAEY